MQIMSWGLVWTLSISSAMQPHNRTSTPLISRSEELIKVCVSSAVVAFHFFVKMTEREDQRICIKFCFKLGKTIVETIEMIKQAFGNDSMTDCNIRVWYNRFKSGRETVASDPRSGRPASSNSPENVEKVRAAIVKDSRLTVRELEDELNIPKTIVAEILTEKLGLRRVAAKFVPKVLTAEQKERRLHICDELQATSENDPDFLKKIITGDESWVYGYDPETKAQSSEWIAPGTPRPKKARRSRSNIKLMLTVFFDHQGIVHHEYAPQGTTITKETYRETLRRLRDAIRRKRPELWASGDWMLQHDNAPAHSSCLVQQFLAKHSIPKVPHPPYSPDLAPCDFWLFPKLKYPMKGTRFYSIEEIRENTTRALKAIPKEDFLDCFKKLQYRWNKCIVSYGEYFEGD